MLKLLVLFGCALGGLLALAGCPQTPDSASSIGNPYPSLEKARAVQPTSDDGFIVMGEVWRPPVLNGQQWLFLSKRNADGTGQWSHDYSQRKPLAGMVGMIGKAVKETPDGGFVVAGLLERWTPGYRPMDKIDIIVDLPPEMDWGGFLLRVDSTGREKWRQVFQDAGSVLNRAYDVSPTPDGGFALAYSTYRFDIGSRSWIRKTDSEGRPTWHVQAPTNGSGQAILALDDGACLLAGSIEYPQPPGGVFLLKADADGDLAWSQAYTGLQAAPNPSRISLRQIGDGNLLVAGAGYAEGTFFLLTTDVDGNETGRFVTTEPLPYRVRSVVTTDDGGCILGADQDDTVGVAPFAIKIGPAGQVEWATPLDASSTVQEGSTYVHPRVQSGYLSVVTTSSPVDQSAQLPGTGAFDFNIQAFSLTDTGALSPWLSL